MKILEVSPKYSPSVGVEEHLRNISERLAKKHDVTVFAADASGKLPREEEINGVLVRRFKSFSPSDAYHLSFEMLNELRKSEFDIVHGQHYHAFPLYFARYAKRRKFVVTPHYHGRGHTPTRDFLIKLYKPFGKRIFADADAIISVSSYEKELLIRDFGIDAGKIRLIPNGIDPAEFPGEGIQQRTKTILCICRLEKYKGVQNIIQTLPLLGKDFHLEIVGSGTYRGELVQLVDRLGLSQRVRFYQDLPRSELLKMYARAGVFVLLSRYEAFSLVVAEALASKTPCVVANTSALKEWVDQKNCFGIDYPIDIDKLAGLINEVIGKRVTGVKLWDWNDVVRELEHIYDLGKD